MFTKEELKKFHKDILKVSSKVAELLAAMLISNHKLSREGIVLGLLKTAAFVSVQTDCPKETFAKLAKIAYSAEKKSSEADKEAVAEYFKDSSKKDKALN